MRRLASRSFAHRVIYMAWLYTCVASSTLVSTRVECILVLQTMIIQQLYQVSKYVAFQSRPNVPRNGSVAIQIHPHWHCPCRLGDAHISRVQAGVQIHLSNPKLNHNIPQDLASYQLQDPIWRGHRTGDLFIYSGYIYQH